jgi:hypothetical protein
MRLRGLASELTRITTIDHKDLTEYIVAIKEQIAWCWSWKRETFITEAQQLEYVPTFQASDNNAWRLTVRYSTYDVVLVVFMIFESMLLLFCIAPFHIATYSLAV